MQLVLLLKRHFFPLVGLCGQIVCLRDLVPASTTYTPSSRRLLVCQTVVVMFPVLLSETPSNNETSEALLSSSFSIFM